MAPWRNAKRRIRAGDIAPPEANDGESASAGIIAEYNVLRGEIGRYQDHQTQIINFAFVLGAAIIAFTRGLYGKSLKNDEALSILLYVPAMYALLSCLFADRAVRIVRLADYIDNHLRRKFSLLLGTGIWQWEVYKRLRPRPQKYAFALDKSRWLVFFIPAIGSVGLYFWSGGGLETWRSWSGLAISVVSLLVCLGAMLAAEETRGAAMRNDPDLDAYDPFSTHWNPPRP
ncbi:hypothetical protein [Actinoallomurus sp. CA-142502]|uniref:hypothetical protein n=1 Tax=Actinoallomurus sp. CA-142502 TaxID=3239885 RepID=UPI003D90D3A2